MEALYDQPAPQPDPAIAQKQRIEDANDFLIICAWYASPALINRL
ncbi:hypothetical protein [Spirosoma endbachense]|nr:hypothetical protein [Spirosoma endbachense]